MGAVLSESTCPAAVEAGRTNNNYNRHRAPGVRGEINSTPIAARTTRATFTIAYTATAARTSSTGTGTGKGM